MDLKIPGKLKSSVLTISGICSYACVIANCFVMLLLLFPVYVQGGNYETTNLLTATQFIAGNSIRVDDPMHYMETPASNFNIKRRWVVRLVYGKNAHTDVAATSSEFELTVPYTIHFSSGCSVDINDNVIIKYHPATASIEIPLGLNTYDVNCPIAELTIGTPVSTGTVPSDVRLELSVQNEEYQLLNTGAITSNIQYNNSSSDNDYQVSWKYVEGAEKYDLEWVFIDAQTNSDVLTDIQANTSNVFNYKDPIRITTSDNHYDIENVFTSGTLYYRIRPIGRFFESTGTDMPGAWSLLHSISVTSAMAFEANKTWEIEKSYAEAGKNKKVVTFYDNTTRKRQMVTNISSNNTVAVAETKYDFEGRPAVNVMPDPLPNTRLNYVPNLNQVNDMSGIHVLDKGDFDISSTSSAAVMDNVSGAANYYSPASLPTPFQYALNMDYIPSAEGYAYTQIMYQRDNTGRPTEQTGVGPTHKLFSGNDTRYFYSNVSATALHRLFGSNVGDCSHYKETITEDPNGQLSVAYQDMTGKTIATALAGISPTNVQQLYYNSPYTITENIIDGQTNSSGQYNPVTHTYDFTFMKFNDMGSNAYTLNYDFLNIAEPSVVTPCPTCNYDVSIYITAPDGSVVPVTVANNPSSSYVTVTTPSTPALPQVVINIRPSDQTAACNMFNNPGNFFGSDLSVTFTATQIGNYTIRKTLSLQPPNIDPASITSLNINGTDVSYADFVSNYDDNIDYSQCDFECASEDIDCKKNHTAITQSIINATPQNSCENMRQEMLSSVQPGGFYFDYAHNSTNAYYQAFWSNVSCALGVTSCTPTCSLGPFNDANGNALIVSSGNDNLGLPIHNATDLFNALQTGALNSADIWLQDWSEILVKAHPEYCQYTSCVLLESSDVHDYDMALYDNFCDAYNNTLNLSGLTTAGWFTDPLNDPINAYTYTVSGTTYTFAGLISNYLNSGLSLLDYISPTIGCGHPLLDGQSGTYGTDVPFPTYVTVPYTSSCGAGSYTCTTCSECTLSVCTPGGTSLCPSGSPYCYFNPMYSNVGYDNGHGIEKQRWILYRSLYQSEKLKFIDGLLANRSDFCGANSNCWDDNVLVNGYMQDPAAIVTDPVVSCTTPACVQTAASNAANDNPGNCASLCAGNVTAWMNILQNLPTTGGSGVAFISPSLNLNTTDQNNIAAILTSYCSSACSLQSNEYLNGSNMNSSIPYNATVLTGTSPSTSIAAYLSSNGYTFNLFPDANCTEDVNYWMQQISTSCPGLDAATATLPSLCTGATHNSDCINMLLSDFCLNNTDVLSENFTILPQDIMSNSDLISVDNILIAASCPTLSESVLPNQVTTMNNCPYVSPAYNDLFAFLNLYPPNISANQDICFSGTCSGSCTDITTVSEPYLDQQFQGYFTGNGCGSTVNLPFLQLRTSPDGQPQTVLLYDRNGVLIPFSAVTTFGLVTVAPNQPANVVFKDNSGTNHGTCFAGIQLTVEVADGTLCNQAMLGISSSPCYLTAYVYFLLEEHGAMGTCPPSAATTCPDPLIAAETACNSLLNKMAGDEANEVWDQLVNNYIIQQEQNYYSQCTPPREVMTLTHQTSEYHYTLYYYDQAGNLVQTVPPEGVHPLPVPDPSLLAGNTNFDVNGQYIGTRSSDPVHTLLTTYKYNALNQVVKQKTPDAGTSVFWYNSASQLRLSLNAQQNQATAINPTLTANNFSFTKYDNLSRIIAVGQAEDAGGTIAAALAYDPYSKNVLNYLDNPAMPDYGYGVFDNVTLTFYDDPAYGYSSFPNNTIFGNDYRNRVVSSFLVPVISAGYTYPTVPVLGSGVNATYYQYDQEGNVADVLQYIDGLGDALTDYSYDLISGKVNKVAYTNLSGFDAFYHKYEYDADNRLTNAYTSADNVVWDEDAEYFYYPHGPLCREEIGEDKVQGRDYYYTIEGWLKGINMPNSYVYGQDNKLLTRYDPGQDGVPGAPGLTALNSFTARDEMSLLLGYNNNDYTPINTTTMAMGDAVIHAASSLAPDILPASGSAKGLYNGNIAYSIANIPKLDEATGYTGNLYGAAYQYDQLNRLKQSVGYYYSGANGRGGDGDPRNAWGISYYNTDYSYDRNGNIIALNRMAPFGATHSGGTALDMPGRYFDQLKYYYPDGAGGFLNEYNTCFDPYGNACTYSYSNNCVTNPTSPVNIQNNRLQIVKDVVTAPYGGTPNNLLNNDIDDQDPSNLLCSSTPAVNYQYDAIGNLTYDKQEEIDHINWNVYGKMASIIRATASTKDNLYFTYDAAGNRISKTAEPNAASLATYPHSWDKTITYYVRDASGNIMSTYTYTIGMTRTDEGVITGTPTLNEVEQEIYGSSRLGIRRQPLTNDFITGYARVTGYKQYELADHLGNVMATIEDRRVGMPATTGGTTASYYNAIVDNAHDYYPFGMIEPARWSAGANKYRFGFNGKEDDNEVKGHGDQQDYGMRVYDTRLGRFLSVDPLTKSYPWYTPYQFAGNKPIWAIDLDGLEEYYTSDGKLIGKFGTNTEIRVVYDSYISATKNIIDAPTDPSANVINEKIYNSGSAPVFKAPDYAAEDYGQRYNATSIDENKEFISPIIKTEIENCNAYTYTEPTVGQEDNASVVFFPSENKQLVGSIHTHGAFNSEYDNNNFSSGKDETDIPGYEKLQINGYVATPNGSLRKYDVYMPHNKDTKLPVELPSDSADPTCNDQDCTPAPLPKVNLNGENDCQE